MISMVQGISAAWHQAGPTRTRLVSYRPRMPEWMKARMRYAKTASANPLLSDRQRQSEIHWVVKDLAERGTAEFGTGFARELARILAMRAGCSRELFIEIVNTYDRAEADRLWEERVLRKPRESGERIRVMTCPSCGGNIEGDGVTVPFHCERIECPQVEPDADPVYCVDDPDEADQEACPACAGTLDGRMRYDERSDAVRCDACGYYQAE